MIQLDVIDKAILARLLGNCRVSYRELARELGVTCPTIKNRVDKLTDTGVIEGFTVEISHETLDISWVLAEITTDFTENRASLVKQLGGHESVRDVYIVGSREYVVLAEIAVPEGLYEFGKFIRSLDGVQNVNAIPIRQLPSKTIMGPCKYVSRGRKAKFNKSQLRVIENLVHNGRLSLADLSDRTGYSSKKLRKILSSVVSSEGANFTIRFNPSSNHAISFLLYLHFDESVATPQDVIEWFQTYFPLQYWISGLFVNQPTIVSILTAENLSEIEIMIRAIKNTDFHIEVKAQVAFHIEKFARSGIGGFGKSEKADTSLECMSQIRVPAS